MLLDNRPRIKATEIIICQSLDNPADFPFSDKEKEFKSSDYTICVKESIAAKRFILIRSDISIDSMDLYLEFLILEKLLMLFEGNFWKIDDVQLKSDEDIDKESFEKLVNDRKNNRPTFYKTNAVFSCESLKLCNWETVLSEKVYNKWKELLNELDIVHPIFLYATADNGIPMELKLPFLIEVAEPLIELISMETGIFTSLVPGERGTSLRMCVDTIISHYGLDIFSSDYKNSDKFTQKLVNTRVRVMHTKRKFKKEFVDNRYDILLYSVKMTLLYRRVLLDLLGIDYQIYSDKIKRVVGTWENYTLKNKLNVILPKRG